MATLHGLKPRFQAALRPLAGRLARAGVTANQVTVAAIVLALGYGAAIVMTVGSAAVLLALPAVLVVRMGLNAIDGMIAREHGEVSRLGACLNEIGDVVADAAIYLPLALALVPGFALLAGLMAVAFALTELAGILARALGGERRYDGPFGKADRAAYFAVLAVASVVPGLPLGVRAAAIGVALALAGLTVVNRLRARRTPVPSMADALAGVPLALLASLAAIWTLLVGASLAVAVMVRRGARNAAELAARVRTWWWIVGAVSVALVAGATATAVLFAGVSLFALREYLAIVPARAADRGAIALALLAVPAQYLLVLDGWYGLFTVFIPVFMTAAIAIRLALAGETAGFLRSTAILQWGLVLTVYNLSHLAFLARLETAPALPAGGAGLLLFLLVVVQSNDVAQYVWGRLLGRRRITPTVSPNKTWAGFLGGAATTMATAALLAPWLTPFPLWQALLAGAGLAALGFAGDITVSAVKRDLGLKDTGAMLPGHGGLLDRLDSLVFAGPVFFHLVRTAYGA